MVKPATDPTEFIYYQWVTIYTFCVAYNVFFYQIFVYIIFFCLAFFDRVKCLDRGTFLPNFVQQGRIKITSNNSELLRSKRLRLPKSYEDEP